MEMLIVGLEMARRLLPRFGPYVLVEIMLPGGTLLALLLYLYQRWNSDRVLAAEAWADAPW
jgi:hypothetical protein